ncbi:MAG: phosphatase PAP2 family protein [Sphingomonadaceae bacterium]|jgi:membrane-associated phospholipid phosphatase|nr:phosphatase PAP2 family protein [Sphingomonadaceae bacterium]NBU77638.1 phosphatase PAP2 family protein [Sphingomonadaceae bacterium]NCA00579.1 phosphatase PAP2 family protein [Sphingomonadaceae bacterium]
MGRGSLLAVASTALCLLATPAVAGTSEWKTASDIGAYGLITTSIGLPALRGDGAGAWQAAGSFGVTSIATEGLKQAFPRTRPDSSNRKSFPSGHTSRSFAAAATIMNREGPALGVPAFLVASFVGVARVEGKKHYWTDVIVGAGIGTGIGLLVTKKRDEASQAAFLPWADTQGAGVTVAARF